MRAVIAIRALKVGGDTLKPDRAYASDVDLAQAMAIAGLTPAALLPRDDDALPGAVLVGSAGEQLEPAMSEQELRIWYQSQAEPILARMPTRSDEDIAKREEASEHIVFASMLQPTGTKFMISRSTSGWVTFRLHNELIERLQRGCEDLVGILSRPLGSVRFEIESEIEIYEHGQEDSTISGSIVGASIRDKVAYVWRESRAQVVTVGVLGTMFAALVSILLLGVLDQYDGVLGQFERLESGVIPILLVTLTALAVKYPRGVRVLWTQRYRRFQP